VVKGGGHGSYSSIVLAPSSVQQMFDLTKRSFALAETYRMSVIILADAYIGQMMESVEIGSDVEHTQRQHWALYGDKESRKNLITSIYMSPQLQRQHNEHLQQHYRKLESELVEYEEIAIQDASVVFVAYGITSRICHAAVLQLRQMGVKAGLLRLQTLYPFPHSYIKALAQNTKRLIVAEMSNGQMAADVKLACEGAIEIETVLSMGGMTPLVDELVAHVMKGKHI